MDYAVVTYGHAALRKKAEPVAEVTDAIRTLAGDMLQAMYRHRGLGLAAEQVNRPESICVIDVPPSHDVAREGGPPLNPGVTMPLVLINPRIVAARGEQDGQEGCLSFPEIFVTIRRDWEVEVAFTGLDNLPHTVTAVGLLARAIQHEIDHLNGVLLVDHLSSVQKLALAGRLKRLKKQSRTPPVLPAATS